MKVSMIRRFALGISGVAAMCVAQTSFGALLLNYQFESVTGSPPSATTPDSSGAVTPLTGNVTGGPTVGTNYPTLVSTPFVSNGTVQSLNPNSSLQFFGGTNLSSGASNSANRVVVPDGGVGSSTLDALFPKFTFAAWVNPLEVTTSVRWIAGKIGGSGERGWQVARGSGAAINDLQFTYFDGPSGASQDISLANFFTSSSEWAHMAIVFDGVGDGVDPLTRSINIYKNGVLALTQTAGVLGAVNGANSIPFMVGHRGTTASGSGAWFGYIDDVRIYDEALTPAQVTGLMNPVPEPGSVALAAFALVGVVVCGMRRR